MFRPPWKWHQRSCRRFCRTVFVTMCVLPTVVVLTWAVNQHLPGAHTASDGALGGAPEPGGSTHPTNACFTYVKEIEDFYAALDEPKVVKNTTAHEFTHQFDADPGLADGVHHTASDPGVVPEANHECIMFSGRDRTLPSRWGIFHVYTVRDETDAQ